MGIELDVYSSDNLSYTHFVWVRNLRSRTELKHEKTRMKNIDQCYIFESF